MSNANATVTTLAAPRPTYPKGELSRPVDDGPFAGYVGEIARPTDTVLNGLGGDMTHYEKLLRDDQVHACLQQRRRAITQCEWRVEAAGDSALDRQAAAHLRQQLASIRFDHITDMMLYGVFYGYAVGECMWDVEDGFVVLTDVRVRKPKRFRFSHEGDLRLMRINAGPGGVALPDRKFWTFTSGAENADDRYGKGLAHWLYWPVFLKRNAIKFWAVTLEKFGSPTTLGSYAGQASEEDKKKLLEAAAAVSTEAAVIIPEGMQLQLLEAQRGAGGDHDAFCRLMDAAIAKVVLSQTMTTDNGSSRSQAEVHWAVRGEVVKGDADLVCESFNAGPAKWLTEWNFPGAKPPKVWRQVEAGPDLKASAELDQVLYNMGYRPTPEYVAQVYGDGYTPAGREEGAGAQAT